MSLQKGDVILARVPHTAGARGKKRPAVVIQANAYNATLRHVVVAEVTSHQRWMSDPACVFIDVTTPDGQVTGLHRNGVGLLPASRHDECRSTQHSGRQAITKPASARE
jgi:mRNA-degrading endonuclease toxin of MazEF toxin-antitoxin module